MRSAGFAKASKVRRITDLALRCIDKLRPEQVRHIPRILYHWRMVGGSLAAVPDAKPYAKEAARRAIADHCKRNECRGGWCRARKTRGVASFYSRICPNGAARLDYHSDARSRRTVGALCRAFEREPITAASKCLSSTTVRSSRRRSLFFRARSLFPGQHARLAPHRFAHADPGMSGRNEPNAIIETSADLFLFSHDLSLSGRR